jgi:hypothetical protein
MKKLFIFALFCCFAFAPLHAYGKEGWNCDETGCSAAIAPTKYYGWEAWLLSDGKTEAIVVPAIGRVMSFRRVGGDEWLWSTKALGIQAADWGGWRNWGGDKTWLSPQGQWDKLGSKVNWPPAPEWNDRPYESEVLSGGHLKITSAVNQASGTRIIREFWHDADGTFIIKQSVEKLRGAPLDFGIWSITQVDAGKLDAVFVPRNPQSDYDEGYIWMSTADKAGRLSAKAMSSTLLKVLPKVDGSYKIGADSTRASLAAMRGDELFVVASARPEGTYPDGMEGKTGTPVQLYGQGDAKMNYVELELLSPLRRFVPGSRWTHTVKWRIEKLPSNDAEDPAVVSAVDKALG